MENDARKKISVKNTELQVGLAASRRRSVLTQEIVCHEAIDQNHDRFRRSLDLKDIIAKFHYTGGRARPDRTRPDKVRGLCLVLAKFHYTGPTGPARTRTTRISEKLRWSVRVSDKVRAGPVGPV